MATEIVRTTAITNLNATPSQRSTAGEGGEGHPRFADGNVTGTTGVTLGSVYRLARVPSNAKIKTQEVWLDAAVVTFTGDVGWFHSDSTIDGTPVAKQGLVVNTTATGGQLGGVGVVLAAVVARAAQEVGLTAGKRLQPLWQACGLASDPGGFMDFCVNTTATTSGAPVINGRVTYVE